MKTFTQFLFEAKASQLTPHPIERMKNETPKGLDWEYDREFGVHMQDYFPDAFSSRDDFQKKYDNAEVRHLTPNEHHSLGNSAHTYYIGRKVSDVENDMGHRRDVGRIAEGLKNGKTAYPIIIKHSDGLHLMAGNTRLSTAAAMGLSIPVKIIDIRDNQ